MGESDFMKRILDFRIEDLSSEKLSKIKSILSDPNLKEESIRDTSTPVFSLFQWLKFVATQADKEGNKGKDIKETKEEPGKTLGSKEIKDMNVSPRKKQEVPKGFKEDIGMKMERINAKQDEFLPEYMAAEQALKEVEKEVYETGFCLDKQTPRIEKVLKCLCVILGEESSAENGRELVKNKETLLKRIRHLDIQDIPQDRIDTVRVWLQDPELRLSCVADDCPAGGDLLAWISAVMNFWIVTHYIETGEMALSEHAEEEAIKQESEIIRSHSKLLDEGETSELTAEEKARLKELDRHASLGEL